jgi:hypothetical protein
MKLPSPKFLLASSLFIILGICKVDAQNNNAVYVELGGNGYLYSINYERTFSNNLIARGGIGLSAGNIALPFHFGKYFGNGSHHVEADLGLTYIHGKVNPENSYDDLVARSQYFATAFLGYRYQNPEKKSIFRIGYTPLYKLYDSYAPFDNNFLYHWAGVSYGFKF